MDVVAATAPCQGLSEGVGTRGNIQVAEGPCQGKQSLLIFVKCWETLLERAGATPCERKPKQWGGGGGVTRQKTGRHLWGIRCLDSQMDIFFHISVLQKLKHSFYLLGKLHIMVVLLFFPATLPASLHSQNKSIIKEKACLLQCLVSSFEETITSPR